MRASAVERRVETIHPRGGRLTRLNDSGPWRACVAPALIPASWLYQSLSSAVRNARAIDVGPTPSGTRVISIGNLEVGGGGKTPLAVHFLERIAAEGGTPAYVSRAFRSISEKLNAVTVVLPETSDVPAPIRPGVRYLGRRSPNLAREIGDEGAMVAARLPGVALVFSRRKRLALEFAARDLRSSHAVLDDAFQSWGVPRDLDVVLLDGRRPFGNGWLLPAGTLREPPEALERADVIGFNGVEDMDGLERVTEAVFRAIGLRRSNSESVFGIRREVEITTDDNGLPPFSGGVCASLAAVGHPEAFERSLDDKGLDLAVAFRYPDHHRYGRNDVEYIRREIERRGIERVITTEKDWAKLRVLDCATKIFVVARLRLELIGEDPLLNRKAAE